MSGDDKAVEPADTRIGIGDVNVSRVDQGGVLALLMAAVRPQFRADVLMFDPRDPVFGGRPCAVPDCLRPIRARGMCKSHHTRWRAEGSPDVSIFAGSTNREWGGHRRLAACLVADCRSGRGGSQGLCRQHARQWKRGGSPDKDAWLHSTAPAPPPSPLPPDCLVAHCDLWARGDHPLCASHLDRWKAAGRPELAEFAASCQDPGPGACESINLRPLRPQLRLEVQFVLQSRRDEMRAKIDPRKVHRVAQLLARDEIASLLDESEDFWRRFHPEKGPGGDGRTAFLLDARRRIEQLADGSGWDIEYPRPIWRLRNLGLGQQRRATISFARIPQPWLSELTKRWARWRLSTGQSTSYVGAGVTAVTRFAAYLAAHDIDGLIGVDRALLERYLGDLQTEFAGRRSSHREHIGALAAFLTAIRRHRWDDTLPATAMVFAEDYPCRSELLPRALAEQVMTQVENPANLDRWDTPAYRLITIVLMRCGLRISSALQLAFDCVITDADGAPYLRYLNTKMKREALVPIDVELQQEIGYQQQRVLQRGPTGAPLLFPVLRKTSTAPRPSVAAPTEPPSTAG